MTAVWICESDPVVLERVGCLRERLKLRGSRLEMRLCDEKAPGILGVAGTPDPEAMAVKGAAFDLRPIGRGVKPIWCSPVDVNQILEEDDCERRAGVDK